MKRLLPAPIFGFASPANSQKAIFQLRQTCVVRILRFPAELFPFLIECRERTKPASSRYLKQHNGK